MAIRIVEKEKYAFENKQKTQIKSRAVKPKKKAAIATNDITNSEKSPEKRAYVFKGKRDPAMNVVSLRLKKETIDFFKEGGKGFTARMAECLDREAIGRMYGVEP